MIAARNSRNTKKAVWVNTGFSITCAPKRCFIAAMTEGVFVRQPEDADGNYRTPLLPGLVVHVPTLWREKLPGPGAVVRAVEAMLHS